MTITTVPEKKSSQRQRIAPVTRAGRLDNTTPVAVRSGTGENSCRVKERPLGTPTAIIFDFGNVIAHFDFQRAIGGLALEAGIEADILRQRAREAELAVWIREFEHGRVGEAEFAAGCCERLAVAVDHSRFFEHWCGIFWANEPVHALVGELDEAGYTLVLGSNTNAPHARHFRRQFATALDRFAGFVFSHEVGHMKPAREFYLACTQAAGAEAAACVFIDDVSENVEGARAAGLHAIHFLDTPQLRRDLARLGVKTRNPLDLERSVAENIRQAHRL